MINRWKKTVEARDPRRESVPPLNGGVGDVILEGIVLSGMSYALILLFR